MGKCSWCGSEFPKTRSTRKYCTPRCKTNACLGRKPRRIRAADVAALYEVLEADFDSAEALQERLRSILRPGSPMVPRGLGSVPRLD